ncbi:MAG: cob(I)yrinic acid a,c-diamide adenosyltransferase [Kiritimatiellia bacterium]
MVHLYTGDGKGKTTAAVGLAARALGQGWRVVFVQFLKGDKSGEIGALEELGAEVIRPPRPHGFWWTLDAREKSAVRREHDRLLREAYSLCRSGRPPDMLVLDEFTYVYNDDMATKDLCTELLRSIGAKTELVITGRNPGPLAACADYLTEMKPVKHPFARGLAARRGIEF